VLGQAQVKLEECCQSRSKIAASNATSTHTTHMCCLQMRRMDMRGSMSTLAEYWQQWAEWLGTA
jgi:hypothetical protein